MAPSARSVGFGRTTLDGSGSQARDPAARLDENPFAPPSTDYFVLLTTILSILVLVVVIESV